MKMKTVTAGALGVLLVASTAAASSVGAWPTGARPAARAVAAHSPAPKRARASVHLDVPKTAAWVGQAIPVTVRAQFREVDGVTIEGLPEIKTDGVATVDLAREPHQSTTVVDGEPVLVATWSGTVTPTTAGSFALTAQLPARLRWTDPPAPSPDGEGADDMADPFSAMDADPSDPSSLAQMMQSLQRSFARRLGAPPSLGRSHEEAVSLESPTMTVNVSALPTAGQPPTFTGAVGRFALHASVASTHVQANDPVTVRVVVDGEGDLDRVDLPGIPSSEAWKAYPTTVANEPSAKKPRRKVFEQVLLPLRGGQLTIPAFTLAAFDPASGKYTSASTAPITVDVDGTPAADVPTAAPPPALAHEESKAEPTTPVAPASWTVSPRATAWRLAPIPLLLAAAVALRRRRRRSEEAAARKRVRESAATGHARTFFDAARQLITVHYAEAWKMPEADVTADVLRARLGDGADPLVEVLATADALRFGGRDVPPEATALTAMHESIEATFRSRP